MCSRAAHPAFGHDSQVLEHHLVRHHSQHGALLRQCCLVLRACLHFRLASTCRAMAAGEYSDVNSMAFSSHSRGSVDSSLRDL